MAQFAEIPLRIDIFAVIIFLGVVQGFFLALLFTFRKGENRLASRLLGICIFVAALLILEIFLGYTALMLKMLYLVDFTEAIAFLIGPLYYLYVKAKLNSDFRLTKKHIPHFLLFFVYSFHFILFIIQPEELKYNSMIAMFYPDLPKVEVPAYQVGHDWLGLFQFHGQIVFLFNTIYFIFTLKAIREMTLKKGVGFFSDTDRNISSLRNFTLALLFSTGLFVLVKLNYEADLGDYLIGSWITVLIYSTSFVVIRQSLFFAGQQEEKKKYSKSSLSTEQLQSISDRLDELVQQEKYFLDESISLPGLAKKLSVSQHHLSQALNESRNKSFFEFIAELRINEAKNILSEKSSKNMTIEEVAFSVGYNSKSAFNTAFKKLTGLTPAQFRKSAIN